MGDVVACPECGVVLEGLVPAGDVDLWKDEATKLLRANARLKREDANAVEGAKRMPDARKVWDHWLATFGKDPTRWKFGKSRKEGVLKALGDYTVEELCEAISGCRVDPWWYRNTKCDIEAILKDAKRIDGFRETLQRKGSE